MKTTREDLEQYAKELRDFFHHHQISSPESLDKHLFGRFPVKGREDHFISVSPRDGDGESRSYVVTYMIKMPDGIMVESPIEVRILPKDNFSTIVAKLDSRLEGYSLFYLSGRRNLLFQDKVLKNTDIDGIKQELSALCDSYAYLQ